MAQPNDSQWCWHYYEGDGGVYHNGLFGDDTIFSIASGLIERYERCLLDLKTRMASISNDIHSNLTDRDGAYNNAERYFRCLDSLLVIELTSGNRVTSLVSISSDNSMAQSETPPSRKSSTTMFSNSQ